MATTMNRGGGGWVLLLTPLAAIAIFIGIPALLPALSIPSSTTSVVESAELAMEPTLKGMAPMAASAVAVGEVTRPSDLIDVDLANWAHAFKRHEGLAACITAVAKNVPPAESWLAYPKGDIPAQNFAWNVNPIKNSGLLACAGLPEMLVAEFVGTDWAKESPEKFRLVMVIGRDRGQYVGISMYAVLAQPDIYWKMWLRDHNYSKCLFGSSRACKDAMAGIAP